jgi:hypothetical protein
MTDTPFSTPESRDALEWLKGLIRANVPADRIEATAFHLTGESAATIDDEVHELFQALREQSPPVPHSEAFALTFALREVIRDRIREIEGYAS